MWTSETGSRRWRVKMKGRVEGKKKECSAVGAVAPPMAKGGLTLRVPRSSADRGGKVFLDVRQWKRRGVNSATTSSTRWNLGRVFLNGKENGALSGLERTELAKVCPPPKSEAGDYYIAEQRDHRFGCGARPLGPLHRPKLSRKLDPTRSASAWRRTTPDLENSATTGHQKPREELCPRDHPIFGLALPAADATDAIFATDDDVGALSPPRADM